MSDRWAVLLAVAAALGAVAAHPFPMAVAAVAALVAGAGIVARRPVLLCLGVAVLTSWLGARSLDGASPASAGPVAGRITVLTDPEELGFSARATVRFEGKRYEAWASGPAGWALARASAGQAAEVEGRVRPAPVGRATSFARRHLVGRLDLQEVGPWSTGSPVVRAANRVRSTLADGAATLGPARVALFQGLVVGDDRHQDPVLADDVDAAGLTHLLAVSGANVAFVLTVARPVLRRLPPVLVVPSTLAVLGWFALLTRGEPSVLRAVAMAGIATVASWRGREAGGLRLLALAITGLLLVDPLLVWSVGFQLSVAASGAIVVLAAPIGRRLPGPRPLADALGVVVAAQLGVAPVAVPTFGPLPLASLPANVLVGPVAGLVTAWGLTGGVVAGLAGEPLARLLHVPTWLALGWLELVASTIGRLPLGHLALPHLAVLAVAVALAGSPARRQRAAAAGTALAVVATALLAAGPRPVEAAALAGGAVLWQRDVDGRTAAVLVLERPELSRLLPALRSAGVRRLDVVVVPTASRSQRQAVAALRRRYPTRVVLVPAGTDLDGAQVASAGDVVVVGDLVVEVTAAAPRLAVQVDGRGRGGSAEPG